MNNYEGPVYCDEKKEHSSFVAETYTNTVLINADAGVQFLIPRRDQNKQHPFSSFVLFKSDLIDYCSFGKSLFVHA